jgi:energy-coupling factor transporter transmembrane protein EcfT
VSDVRVDKIPAELKESFTKNYKSERDGKIKIPMAAAYRFLEALGDNVGKLYKANESRFLDIQKARNYSYLAHGFENTTDKTYQKLKDFVLALKAFEPNESTVFPKVESQK